MFSMRAMRRALTQAAATATTSMARVDAAAIARGMTVTSSSSCVTTTTMMTAAMRGPTQYARSITSSARCEIKTRAGGDTSKLRPEERGLEAPMTSFEAGATQTGWGSAGGGQLPWTPTRELKKRKSYFKRCGHIMETLEREHMKSLCEERKVIPFRPGDVVKLTLEVPENRRRTQVFTGICIGKKNRGMGSSFTVRSVVGNFAVERTFPLFSPNIKGMEILERRKVRRAKLYYLRDKPLRFSRP